MITTDNSSNNEISRRKTRKCITLYFIERSLNFSTSWSTFNFHNFLFYDPKGKVHFTDQNLIILVDYNRNCVYLNKSLCQMQKNLVTKIVAMRKKQFVTGKFNTSDLKRAFKMYFKPVAFCLARFRISLKQIISNQLNLFTKQQPYRFDH